MTDLRARLIQFLTEAWDADDPEGDADALITALDLADYEEQPRAFIYRGETTDVAGVPFDSQMHDGDPYTTGSDGALWPNSETLYRRLPPEPR